MSLKDGSPQNERATAWKFERSEMGFRGRLARASPVCGDVILIGLNKNLDYDDLLPREFYWFGITVEQLHAFRLSGETLTSSGTAQRLAGPRPESGSEAV